MPQMPTQTNINLSILPLKYYKEKKPAGYLARIAGVRNAHRITVEKLERMKPFGVFGIKRMLKN